MKRQTLGAVLLAVLLLCGCGAQEKVRETVDPYAGMVQVRSGFGDVMVWVTEYADIPASALAEADFRGGEYIGRDLNVRTGVDVSQFQGSIDWKAVAESGVDFAVIRAGGRGYGEAGTLYEDVCFDNNMKGAAAAGVDIGVYFFSQATDAAEAVAEAEFLLEMLRPYGPEALALPVYFDWEYIDVAAARTDGLDGETLTDCAVAFCETLAAAGYTPGVYFTRAVGYFRYDLPRLKDWSWWFAGLGDWPDFYYAHDLWQCSDAGSVPGVIGNVDLDLWLGE